MATATIIWVQPSSEPPDAALRAPVLLSLQSPRGNCYTTTGYYSEDGWYDCTGWPIEANTVVAWAHYPEPCAPTARAT